MKSSADFISLLPSGLPPNITTPGSHFMRQSVWSYIYVEVIPSIGEERQRGKVIQMTEIRERNNVFMVVMFLLIASFQVMFSDDKPLLMQIFPVKILENSVGDIILFLQSTWPILLYKQIDRRLWPCFHVWNRPHKFKSITQLKMTEKGIKLKNIYE